MPVKAALLMPTMAKTNLRTSLPKNKTMNTAQEEATTLAEPKKTVNISGSVALLEGLIAEGTDTIFGYPGGAIMPIYDALYDYKDKLKHILVRHEQGGTHAGQGYARTSGKVGVVFGTSGRAQPTWLQVWQMPR